ncbi:MAG: multiheme c-type cytochrome [Isosphaeraceae bacterium]
MCPILYDKFSPIESSHTITTRIRRNQRSIIPLLVLILPGCGQNQAQTAKPCPPAATVSFASSLTGSGSCSAVACHGSIARVARSNVRRNEHTTWITQDPHSSAYQTLLGDRSERIVLNLSAWAGPVLPAERDERCLACHTTPRPEAELEVTATLNQDGVGCESCHGGAAKWLGPHTTERWKGLDSKIKEREYGLRATKELAQRVKVCTGCHVGRRSPDGLPPQEVNHDLIAAGHPRLNFEFAAYQENLPVHWDEKERNAAADFPALAWAVGQLATTKAALELLRRRAACGTSPWPEFSEFSCFSCHHELADEEWRRKRPADDPKVRSDVPRWGSWHVPMARALALADKPAGLDPRDDGKPFEVAIEKLLAEMTKPIPDRKEIPCQVNALLEPLDRRLREVSSRSFSLAEVERLITMFDDPKAWEGVDCWDHATQRYLALVPFYQVWCRLGADRVADQRKLKQRLDELLRRLTFDEGFESPQGFDPARVRK